MTDQGLQWNKCTTLSKQIVDGQPAAKEFFWATDLNGNIHIKSKRTSQIFSGEDYQAMISHVSASRGGVPTGRASRSRRSREQYRSFNGTEKRHSKHQRLVFSSCGNCCETESFRLCRYGARPRSRNILVS